VDSTKVAFEAIERDGRIFVPAEASGFPEWPCVIGTHAQTTLTLKDDDLFLITDTLGNISGCAEPGRKTSLGLYCRDTCFLSRLELQIEGRMPILLSSNADRGFSLSVLCANPKIEDRIPTETIGIQREIVLNGGLFEELLITNCGTEPVEFELTLSFDADFADLFEIRGFARTAHGQLLRWTAPETTEVDARPLFPNEIHMAYLGLDGALMESRIQFSYQLPDRFFGNTAIWKLSLASHAEVQLGYRLQMLTDSGPTSTVNIPMTLMQAKAAELMEEKSWQNNVTRIRTDDKALNRVIARAEQDIYLLRQSFGRNKVLSAGVPWFSTLFGRDSLISASQTLILDSTIARDTLTILAQYQGKSEDPWRDEAPGKMLHELRLGEMARCREIPHTPYYGTVDATPLWLMLYAEYYAWTHDHELLERLWPNACLAMDWIDHQMQKSGYLTYECFSDRGLRNQGWKDSENCIVNRQGRLVQGPIALSEVQAYVYAAKVRLSGIAALRKRIDLADRWQEEADDLRERFNRDFWLEDQDFCALALDGSGKPVDSVTSNPGHCLSLGILTPERALLVAERLRAPDMFNGWGIRTLSSLSPAYNPMGYHIGSVWPHDNGLIALGLRSLGLVEQALELSQGLIDMTLQQPYCRPPELLCGYDRSEGKNPIQYPVACSPQAWASGSIFQLIQMIANLVPDAPSNCVHIIDPALPESIQQLSLENLRIGTTLIDLIFERTGDSTACRVTRKRGNLRVVIEA
jgi:glycogen debranching enzyme